MNAKKIILLLLVNLCVNMIYSQKVNNDLHKKWLIYNTSGGDLDGWKSFSNNYILDFTNQKLLKIKTLGIDEVVTIEYSFNDKTGVICESNGEVLYQIKELSSDRLVLIMGNKSNISAFFTPLENSINEININNLNSLLVEKKWFKEDNNIEFTNEKYIVANEIKTNYNIFYEYTNKENKLSKGAWLLDTYNGIIFLELFSEKLNHRAVYLTTQLNKTNLKSTAFNRKGELLFFEINR